MRTATSSTPQTDWIRQKVAENRTQRAMKRRSPPGRFKAGNSPLNPVLSPVGGRWRDLFSKILLRSSVEWPFSCADQTGNPMVGHPLS